MKMEVDLASVPRVWLIYCEVVTEAEISSNAELTTLFWYLFGGLFHSSAHFMQHFHHWHVFVSLCGYAFTFTLIYLADALKLSDFKK